MTATTSTAPPVSAATVWRFVLPIALTSANDHVVNGRHIVAAAMYRKRRDQWAWWLRAASMAAGVPRVESTVTFRRVTITWLWGKGQRAWDDDNLVAACKALRDAMQAPRVVRGRRVAGASIVVDDSAKWSAWTYAQERAADGVAAVRIEVSETTTAGGEPVRSE